MSYFSMFPLVYYDAKASGTHKIYTNLMSRLKLVSNTKETLMNFDYYNVIDGDTPESISFKYYGDIKYHWTVMFVNDITDYYSQWPMTVQKFEEFVNDKYVNPMNTHHFEITQTSGETSVVIDVGMNTVEYPSATNISNYQYEESLEEQKRQIRLIQPKYIEQFVTEFERKLNESV